MQYIDRIYGKFEITEPVILELINCPSLQRLKEISQYGYYKHFGNFRPNRFEHSVGVFLLLRKYNTSLKEQIAGLIHDVSHAAFSHCIDYVFDEGSEKEHNHQDNIFENFIQKTKIPVILQKHGFDLEYILNDKNFPLKEKDLPDLCADRIDYVLRDAVILGELSQSGAREFINNLSVINNCWVFKNKKSAENFANLFLAMNQKHYASFQVGKMFRTTGDYFRYAHKKGYVQENDFYKTDNFLLTEVKKHHNKDSELRKLFDRMDGKINIHRNSKNYNATVYVKSRMVNPSFLDKKITKLSEVNQNWAKIIKNELKPKKYFLKFER